MKVKVLLLAQIITSVFGTVFAFTSVYFDFQRFYTVEGSYTKIKNCVIPNPVVTPCFWGAFGFLAATIWAFIIYKKYFSVAKKSDLIESGEDKDNNLNKKSVSTESKQSGKLDGSKIKKQQKYFSAFTLFGTAFAWANMFVEFIRYFKAGGAEFTGCSGATVTNPFLTSCFGGSIIFLVLFIISIISLSKLKKDIN